MLSGSALACEPCADMWIIVHRHIESRASAKKRANVATAFFVMCVAFTVAVAVGVAMGNAVGAVIISVDVQPD